MQPSTLEVPDVLIYLSAGEHSGDLHGASLARILRQRLPDLRLIGMGGPHMREAGVELLFDPTRRSTIGFFEVLRGLRRYKRMLRQAEAVLAANRPAVVVWIDFGGFNLALAKICKRLAIPIVCVFSPSAWAYGQKRALLMAERLTELAAVLPFEAEFYRSRGVKTTFVGHPLLDLAHPALTPVALRNLAGLNGDEPILALLPGSRRQEIQRLLPVMLEAAKLLLKQERRLQLVLPLASSISREPVEAMVAASGLRVTLLDGHAHDVMAACKAAMLSSGTATLEAAIIGAPHVSIYRVSAVSAMIYRALMNPGRRRQEPSSALPNLVAGERIVPELLQDKLTPAALASEIGRILDDEAYRAAMIEALARVKASLGAPGAMERVAGIVLRTAGVGSESEDAER